MLALTLIHLLSIRAAPQLRRDHPFPHRARAFYSIDDPLLPSRARDDFEPPLTSVELGREKWHVEPDAIVCDSPRAHRVSFSRGLPVGGLRSLCVSSDGAFWAAGDWGVVRYERGAMHPWDRWEYFSGKRYLPSDTCKAIVAGEDRSVWVLTSAGVAHLRFDPMTLSDKAAIFETRIDQRHRRHGLVSSSSLATPGDLSTSHQYPNDNDGLWTAIYAAAECFRYSITHDLRAFENARASLEAMMRLEQITGRAGFPARSFRHRTEPRHSDGVWHFTADGDWEWKGDTSSDELVGHFFAYSIAYDLLRDSNLRVKLRNVVSRIADHLIDHGYNLTDVTGKPTRWGRYTPEYFATEEGREDMALDSLELLSHLKVAYHVTGNDKYQLEYQKLISKLHYDDNIATGLRYRKDINYSDEELAMLSFYPLFRYEKNPSLLREYRRGLEQWQQNIRREANPLWIYIYATARPVRRPTLDDAVRTLQRIPLDLVEWAVDNSHRHDVTGDAELDRFGRRQTTRLLPPDERPVMKWNGNPFRLDGGNEGMSEDDGAFFLLPYWLGRYYLYVPGE